MFDMTGKAALVTGGASGIGWACAQALAAAGAKVAIVDRDSDQGNQAADALADAGATATFVDAELADPDQAEAAVAAVEQAFGRLDAAVNAAGILGPTGPLHALDRDAYKAAMANNLDSVVWCMQHEIAAMLRTVQAGGEAGDGAGGSIVNISSAAGVVGFPSCPTYTAGKHAIIGLTRTAAVDYATQGVRVNAIAPGGVDTPLIRSTTCATAEGRATIEGLHPMQRLAQPSEMAGAALYLCSKAASFVTGAVIPVDGGWTAQ
ncbi:SDR family NAD(P)-dependent oxidoreductase [Rhodovibrio sodomensis]|nr:SDR family oxidoreductase [Rhodovibrio sodomensis]